MNNLNIPAFIPAVIVCLHMIFAALIVPVPVYAYLQNREVKTTRYLLAVAVSLFVWNLGYALGYIFAGSFVVVGIIRLIAEAGMIGFFESCVYYVREITADKYNAPYWMSTLHKIVLTLLWLFFGARGILYPFGPDRAEIYLRLVRLFRLPAVIFMIAIMAYIARLSAEWRSKVRYKRGLAIVRMLGDFSALMIVAAILDIVFPGGYLVDIYNFSAFMGALATILLTVVTIYSIRTSVTMANATTALKGDIPTPLFIIAGEETKIMALNNAALRFLGKAEEDIKGHSMSEFFDTSIDEATAMRRSFDETKYYFDKGTVRGAKKPCRFVTNNIHDAFGDPFCAVTFVYDLSSEEEMIERLKESAQSAERANSARGMFLANMSHEIRTPMNAIIGMAEIGLRDSTEPQVQEELQQIKSAGNGLLEIINDILDFSKIESGTLEIVNAEFEPLLMINDLVNIVRQRFHDKQLEFIVRINPHFPSRVRGDEGRIKQVLLNILNNALKYTDEGCVKLTVDFENQDNCILMQTEIEDSGIGIKEEEQERLFKSYHQLDVYKNRNKEGTGLGLSISKRLVDLMDGAINVSSVYGEGSTFSITIPLEVTDYAECISVNKPAEIQTATFLKPSRSEEAFRQLLKDIGIRRDIQCTYPPDVMKAVKSGAKFVFIDEEFLNREHMDLSGAYQDVKVIAVTNSAEKYGEKRYICMQRPEFGMKLMSIFGGEKMTEEARGKSAGYNYNFKAPGARVLIVDDNAVNLSVAEGLLKPFEIQVDTIQSGEEAVKIVGEIRYDIVFMDHMMPGMDGVAATRYIREDMGDKELIIIALTANAIRGTDTLLKQVGMNDFIAKPIDMEDMAAKLRKWLPAEKIVEAEGEIKQVDPEVPEILRRLDPKDIDIEQGLTYTGGDPDTFIFTIKVYREEIENNIALMERAIEQEDVRDFTIRIHALKSASRSVGASQLADAALKLEMSGKNDDLDFIRRNAPRTLARYREYLDILKDFVDEKQDEDSDKKAPPLSVDEFEQNLVTIRTAVNDFDIDVALESINWIKKHRMRNDSEERLISRLERLVEDLEYEDSIMLIDEYFKEAGKGK